MKTRTSVVLAVLALGLGLFIYFFESDLPTTDELRDRGDRLLPAFDRDRVDRLVLGSGDDRVTLERTVDADADAGPAGAVGSWRLVHPMELDADPEEVDSLLSALDWLERRRVVEEPGAGSDARFGLAEPRRQVELRLRGRELRLLVGGDAPGQGLYVARSDEPDQAFVVDQEFLDQISKTAGDLRDKRLVRLEADQLEAIRLSGRFHLRRSEDDRWQMETPLAMRADARAVDALARDLERMRVERFVADDVGDDELGRYGLDRPRLEVTLRIEGRDEPVTMQFGAECEGHASEVAVTVASSGTVACVAESFLDELDVESDTLREMHLTRLEAGDLARIEVISSAGAQVELVRDSDRWRLGEDGPEADEESVEALVETLRETSASDVTRELEPAGLEGDEPEADLVVRLHPEAEGAAEDVLFVAAEPTGTLIRRGDEAVALVLETELVEQLRADPLHYHQRRLAEDDPDDAVELEIRAGSSRQLLRKQGHRWRLVEPVELFADDVRVAAVVRGLSRLEAERFVAAEPAAAHGLTRPRLRVRVRFGAGVDGGVGDGGAPSERVLVVGGEAEGGAYARLEGGDAPVFVVDLSLVEQLEAPLVSRDLFAFDDDRVEALVIERPGEPRMELSRGEGGWEGLEGEASASVVAGEILSRLSVARAAEVVGYGPPPAVAGLTLPRARVTIHLAGEGEAEERVIELGAEYGDEESGRRVYGRRQGVDVTFGLPLGAVRPILEAGASPDGGGEAADDASPGALER